MKLLTTPEAAAYIRKGITTLQHWRAVHIGPPFEYQGRRKRAVYRQADLDRWKELRASGKSMAEATAAFRSGPAQDDAREPEPIAQALTRFVDEISATRDLDGEFAAAVWRVAGLRLAVALGAAGSGGAS